MFRVLFIFVSGLFLMLSTGSVTALTMNGNDFALYFSEAKDTDERSAVFEEAKGNPHFFRYLQIMEMKEETVEGREVIEMVAFEPASLMDISFTLSRSRSMQLLKEEPESKLGSALALTGKVIGVDLKKNTVRLGSVIVKHKDRLSPAIGKELLCEVDSKALFYSYTAGPRFVGLTYKDRDLLQYREKYLDDGSPKKWVEFLEKELARRDVARNQGEETP